jgi:hypothetical protein
MRGETHRSAIRLIPAIRRAASITNLHVKTTARNLLVTIGLCDSRLSAAGFDGLEACAGAVGDFYARGWGGCCRSCCGPGRTFGARVIGVHYLVGCAGCAALAVDLFACGV